MPLMDLTNDNFDDLTESYDLLILDFWADWCGPCHAFAPTFKAASERHPDVLFGKINTETETGLAKQFEIFSIPTLITARKGEIVFARPGTMSDVKLEQLVAELRKA